MRLIFSRKIEWTKLKFMVLLFIYLFLIGGVLFISSIQQTQDEAKCAVSYKVGDEGEWIERLCGSLTLPEYLLALLGAFLVIIPFSVILALFRCSKSYVYLKNRIQKSTFISIYLKSIFFWLSIGFLISTLFIPLLIETKAPYPMPFFKEEYTSLVFFSIIGIIFLFGLLINVINYFVKNKKINYMFKGGLGGVLLLFITSWIFNSSWGIIFEGFPFSMIQIPIEGAFFILMYPLSKVLPCGSGHPDGCALLIIAILPFLLIGLGILFGYFTFKTVNFWKRLMGRINYPFNVTSNLKKMVWPFVVISNLYFIIYLNTKGYTYYYIANHMFILLFAPVQKLDFSVISQYLSSVLETFILLFYLLSVYLLVMAVSNSIKNLISKNKKIWKRIPWLNFIK